MYKILGWVHANDLILINYLSKDSISKYSQLSETLGIRTSIYKFFGGGRTQFSP